MVFAFYLFTHDLELQIPYTIGILYLMFQLRSILIESKKVIEEMDEAMPTFHNVESIMMEIIKY